MKIQVMGSGITISNKQTVLALGLPNFKKVSSGVNGFVFTYPYADDVLDAVDSLSNNIFSVSSAGECEIGDALICSHQTNNKDTIELIHSITLDDISILFCGEGSFKNISDITAREIENTDVVIVEYKEGITNPQEAYSFGQARTPTMLVFIDIEKKGVAEFQKIASNVQVVGGTHTIKRTDLEGDRMFVIVLTK